MASRKLVAGFDVGKCPKGMLNGPCGGVNNGLCEVGGKCVWVSIYAKLKSGGRLREFSSVRLPEVFK